MAKKKKKLKSIKTIKTRIWKVFSEYIRRRDAGHDGNCSCITCGTILPWEMMQAGHFVGGRTNSVLFNEEVCFAQCRQCNIFLYGNYQRYTVSMIKKYGMYKTEELLNLKHEIKKYSRQELMELEQELKGKINALSKP